MKATPLTPARLPRRRIRTVTLAVALLGLLAILVAACGGAAATPTPEVTVNIASGSFTADLGSWGQAFDIEATGTGDDVSGTMEVSSPEGTWSVDLQCSRTDDDGLPVIAGEVTESTNPNFAEGAYVAILLAPGTPVRTILWLDDDASPADSCTAFLETMFSDPEFSSEGLFPIEGDLELGS